MTPQKCGAKTTKFYKFCYYKEFFLHERMNRVMVIKLAGLDINKLDFIESVKVFYWMMVRKIYEMYFFLHIKHNYVI